MLLARAIRRLRRVSLPAGSPPPASPGELPSFTLTSGATQNAPFSIGQAFAYGDVPSGYGVEVTGATAQVAPKNLWPDGSLKFAVISGVASLTANVPATVSLAAGTSSSGTALTTADLQSAMSGQTCSITSSVAGTVSWATTDWDSSHQQIVSGHKMSSWTYRKPIGSDEHLVGWLEVRLWDSGAVEVLPWIENGYLLVASPTNKSATYSFTLGGTERFSAAIDLPHHCRTPLVSGAALSYWLGTDPGVTVQHDTDYLMATDLVPAYSANVTNSSTAYTRLPTSFTPLQQGGHRALMGDGGYSETIGLLPDWDVAYLCGNADVAPVAWAGVQRNAYSLGRYPIHYRNEATNRPLIRTDTFTGLTSTESANLCLAQSGPVSISGSGASTTGTYCPVPSGTTPSSWTYTHHPSPGFLAYLMTGRAYFLEGVQFASNIHWLRDHSGYRQGATGVFALTDGLSNNTTRGVAWALRTMAQAACITPDADAAMRANFVDQCASNVNYYNTETQRYVDAQGWIQPHASYTTDVAAYFEATWMNDFLTAAIGYTKALRLGLGANLDTLFAWKAQSVVGRLGGSGSTEYLYRDAATYNMAIAPSLTPDWAGGTGPWYANWGAVYDALWGGTRTVTDSGGALNDPPWTKQYSPTADPFTKVEGGPLRALFMSDTVVTDSAGYWGNVFQALAYVVKHGATGAVDGYRKVANAPNYYVLSNNLDSEPVNALVPQAVPRWRRGQAVNEWREITASSMSLTPPTLQPTPYDTRDAANKVTAWNGFSVDRRTNTIWALAVGGHNDYYGNEVMRFELGADGPQWIEHLASSAASNGDTAAPRYPDGRPSGSHAYFCQQFIERHNRAVRVGSGSVSSAGGESFWDVDGFDSTAAAGVNGWDAQYTYDRINAPTGVAGTQAHAVCKDPDTEQLYVFASNNVCRRFTPGAVGGTWANLGDSPPGVSEFGFCASTAFDVRRNRILVTHGGYGGTYPNFYTFDTAAGTYTEQTRSGAGQAGLDALRTCIGLIYVPQIDAYLARGSAAGATVYKIDASTFEITTLSTTGGGSVPAAPYIAGAAGSDYENIFTRWLYVPSLRGVVYFPAYTANAWFLRLY